jgi:5-dehydro-2-deoxygluconokinase
VGRSIFSSAANGWLRGAMDDEAAIADMASRYRRLIEFWLTHRNAQRSGRSQAAG